MRATFAIRFTGTQDEIDRSVEQTAELHRSARGKRIYDLRHSRATLAIEGGEDPMVTSEILGHATVEFTLNKYAHVHRERKQESAAIMERVLFG